MSTGQYYGTANRHDPLRNYNYRVSLTGRTTLLRAGFSRVTGIKGQVETKEYVEGGENITPKIIPGMLRYEPIAMERGMSLDMELVTLFSKQFSALGMDGGNRYTITIDVMDRNYNLVAKRFRFKNALFTAFETGDLEASVGGILISRIVFSYEDVAIENGSDGLLWRGRL